MEVKEILVLYSRDTYPDGKKLYEHHVDMLNEQAEEDNIPVRCYYGILAELIFYYDGVSYTVTEPRSGRDIADFDLVFFQKWKFEPQAALAAAVYLDSRSVTFKSSELLRQNPFDKLSEMSLLVTAGLPYAHTVSTAKHILRSHGAEMIKTYPLQYPVIVKPIAGTRGEGIELLRGEAEFIAYIDGIDSDDVERVLVQEFVPNDHDYRVTILGDKIAYVLRRTAAGGAIINNTSAGATAEFVGEDEWGEPAIQDAILAARSVGREDFAGVDVLVGKDGRHIILEVNKSPEIQTGHGVTRKMSSLVKYLADEAGGGS